MTCTSGEEPEREAVLDPTPPSGAGTAQSVRESAELQAPVVSPLAYLRPRFLRADQMLVDVPFIAWLVETVRPHVAVQLGLGSGSGYLALCEAMKATGGGACYGIAAPEVSDGSSARPSAELMALAAKHHRGLSTLIAGGAEAGADEPTLPDEVDLLIVRGASGEHDGMEFGAWLSRLSKRGVVVTRDAGASALAETLAPDRPILRMDEDDGLRALLFGSDQDERLRHLAILAPGSPSHYQAWHVLRRLGRVLADEAEAEARETALREAQSAREVAERRRRTAAAGQAEAEAAARERQARIAELEAQLHDHEAAAASEGSSTKRVAALEAEVAALRLSEATRFEELAVLARMIEAKSGPAAPTRKPTKDLKKSRKARGLWGVARRVIHGLRDAGRRLRSVR